jgi:hypothetical protein
MRSSASLKSFQVMTCWFVRAAIRAASLVRFSRSAPENMGVASANLRMSTSSATGLLRTCTLRMSSRSRIVGRPIVTWRSKRPGRSSAGSRMSGRLVAAMMMTEVSFSNPSISDRIWFRVCSRSSWPPPMPAPRRRPIESSSSMKMIAGLALRASSKRLRTRLAPTPTNISMNSEAETVRKGTPASPATARASSVLPVPGGPTSSTPLGISAPMRRYFCGFFRKSTTSLSSCFASAWPATSPKVVATLFSRPYVFALLWPNCMTWFGPPWARMKMNQKNAIRMTIGSTENRKPIHCGGLRIVTSPTFSSSRSSRESLTIVVTRKSRRVTGSPPMTTWLSIRSSPSITPLLRSIVTRETRPSSTSWVKVLKLISRGVPPVPNWLNTKMPRMISITTNHGLKVRLTLPPRSDSRPRAKGPERRLHRGCSDRCRQRSTGTDEPAVSGTSESGTPGRAARRSRLPRAAPAAAPRAAPGLREGHQAFALRGERQRKT